MTTEDKFKAAVNIIRSLPKDGPYQPSHDMMLKFYGLYKQAVEGPCTEPKPAFYEVVKGYKWRAWNSLGDMSKTDAMNCYVDELKKIIETMAYTENVANFIDALGPFYEFIDIPGMKLKKNNIKDIPEDEQPDGHYKNGEDSVKSVLNGHFPAHKRNGNQEGDSDSESDLTHLSSQNSSPQLMSVASNGPIDASLAQELKEAGEEDEEDDDEEEEASDQEEEEEEEDDELLVVKVQQQENVTTHTVSLSPKAYSDSDSDEEYSEPAESPEHLAQVDTGLAEQAWSSTQIHHLSNTQLSTEPPTIDTAALPLAAVLPGVTLADVVTCGGGDQSHPGGLQMTPRQIQQGSRSVGGTRQVSRASSGSLSTPLHLGGFFQSSGGSGGSGGGGGGRGGANLTEDVNAQLVVVLRRLQTDMESVLHRLNTLETLTVTQHHTLCRQCQGGSGIVPSGNRRIEPSWWPFPELSPRSTFFLLVWPLILHGGLKLLLLLRSRRRRS